MRVRKIIAIMAMFTLVFIVVFCLVTEYEIPQTIQPIITLFGGFIGYYFGKSTALEGAETNGERKEER